MSLPDVPPGFPPRPVAQAVETVYTVIDASGEVARVVRTNDAQQLAANVPAGGQAIAGLPPTAAPSDSYLVSGVWTAKPARPTAFHRWDVAAKTWVETRTLAELQDAKWAAMKAERERRMGLPMPTTLGSFDATPTDQDNLNKVINLLQLAIAAGGQNSANYTLADNSRPAFTLAQLQSAALQIGAQVQALYDAGQALRLAIYATTSAAQLSSITWT